MKLTSLKPVGCPSRKLSWAFIGLFNSNWSLTMITSSVPVCRTCIPVVMPCWGISEENFTSDVIQTHDLCFWVMGFTPWPQLLLCNFEGRAFVLPVNLMGGFFHLVNLMGKLLSTLSVLNGRALFCFHLLLSCWIWRVTVY